MNVFSFPSPSKDNNANNAAHYVKLGKKRRRSSKRNYYIISPTVIIKAIIIIQHSNSGKICLSSRLTLTTVPLRTSSCWSRNTAAPFCIVWEMYCSAVDRCSAVDKCSGLRIQEITFTVRLVCGYWILAFLISLPLPLLPNRNWTPPSWLNRDFQ